jgi:DNA-binding MarR family transcriptional regulator
MEGDGLVSFEPNPHHQRAKLVPLTPRGKAAYDAAMKAVGKQSFERTEHRTG